MTNITTKLITEIIINTPTAKSSSLHFTCNAPKGISKLQSYSQPANDDSNSFTTAEYPSITIKISGQLKHRWVALPQSSQDE